MTKMSRTRNKVQIVFFLVFAIIFFFNEKLPHISNSSVLGYFLRLNPFTTIITSISSRTVFFPALIIGIVVVLFTAVMGRVFCGWFCPLGSLVDLSDYILRKKLKLKIKNSPKKNIHLLKYIFMYSVIIFSVLGVTVPVILGPLLLITRFFTLILRPAVMHFAGLFVVPENAYTMKKILMISGYGGAFTAFILLSVVIVGSVLEERFWCQYICPTGAFLGLIGKFSFFSRYVDTTNCNSCGYCNRVCPTSAIGQSNIFYSKEECIVCGKCIPDKKNIRCSEFKFVNPLKKIDIPEEDKEKIKPFSEEKTFILQRRNLILGTITTLFYYPVVSKSIINKRPSDSGLIRPPGAVSENEFLSRCITCDACVRVCPENALVPASLSDGIINFNTPKLQPRQGFCRRDCNECSNVCPTGAIVPYKIEDKMKKKIGTAHVYRDLCRPWTGSFNCGVCARKCPYNAIDMVETSVLGKKFKVPVVNTRKCVGCGVCEYYCPSKHKPAIRVSSSGERRTKLKGIK